jgi:hypothetical protein
MPKIVGCFVFLREGQKGFRRSARKRVHPLAQNFVFCWFIRYTF